MELSTNHFAREVLRLGLAVPLLSMIGPFFSASANEGTPPANEGVRVGSEVLLKMSGTPLFDQGRQVATHDQLTFVVERQEDERIEVVARDKSIRGWLLYDQVVVIDRAREHLDRVLTNDPRDAEAYWTRARLAYYQNDDEHAFADLNQAIGIEPAQARYYVTRALVQLRRQKWDRVLDDCDQALRLDPKSTQTFAIRALVWLSKNDAVRAHASLQSALRLDATNPSRGVELLALESPKASLDEAPSDRSAPGDASKPDKAELESAGELVKRGEDHFAMKEYDRAIADFNDAIRIDANYAPAYASRARAWARKHYRDREIADCTEAIKRDPKNAAYLVARAESWSAQGMHKRAMADYEEALRMEPRNPAFWVSRGDEWRRDLKLDDAIADYSHALAIDPRYGPAYIARGSTWKQRRAFDQAIHEFSGLIRIDPENAQAHQTLARILATCNEPRYRNGKWAVDEATRACELTHWQDADCLDTLAAAYAEVSDFAAAVKWQTLAIKLTRQNAPSLLQQKATSFGGRKGVGFDDRLGFYKSKKPTRE
jgi:tetratricopeptide (TPR) repeat protein